MIGGANRAGAVIARIRGFLKSPTCGEDGAPSRAGVRDVLVLFQPEVMRHRIVMRTTLADDSPPVLGDQIQLQQVVLNLANNGIEAMRKVRMGAGNSWSGPNDATSARPAAPWSRSRTRKSRSIGRTPTARNADHGATCQFVLPACGGPTP